MYNTILNIFRYNIIITLKIFYILAKYKTKVIYYERKIRHIICDTKK